MTVRRSGNRAAHYVARMTLTNLPGLMEMLKEREVAVKDPSNKNKRRKLWSCEASKDEQWRTEQISRKEQKRDGKGKTPSKPSRKNKLIGRYESGGDDDHHHQTTIEDCFYEPHVHSLFPYPTHLFLFVCYDV
ncbi:hypothetical protein LINPERPRIM_LOCUS6282 [Linum perenne]